MKSHWITGGNGARIHLVETGNANGLPIVFLHGFSQCWMVWRRQLDSELSQDFRLVAMDLRGHGLSDKPCLGYTESKLWAEDVHATIQALALDWPLLCGWSYAALVILDYIRHYGEKGIRGINLIGGVTKLGGSEAASVLSPEFLGLFPGFFSADVEQSVDTLESFLRLCFASALGEEERYCMVGYNLAVPPYVRREMFARSLDNDDILATIQRPVLIVHGAEDKIVPDHRHRPTDGAHWRLSRSDNATGRTCMLLGRCSRL